VAPAVVGASGQTQVVIALLTSHPAAVPRRYRVLARRAGRAVLDARLGWYYGYPPCCVAVFCWDILLGRKPALHRVLSPRMFPTVEAWPLGVPCGIFHGRPSGVSTWRSVACALQRGWGATRPGGVFWIGLRLEAQAIVDREEVARLEGEWWTDYDVRVADPCSPVEQDPALDRELDWS
jgi:hypothetical protein